MTVGCDELRELLALVKVANENVFPVCECQVELTIGARCQVTFGDQLIAADVRSTKELRQILTSLECACRDTNGGG